MELHATACSEQHSEFDAPGENRWVTIVVQNTGSETWAANRLRLVTKDTPPSFWGQTVTNLLPTSVGPGGTATFAFLIKAPPAPGTYAFRREMKDYGGIGDFRTSDFCIDQTIEVGGAQPLNAAVSTENFPTTMAPGESKAVSVTMTNTGSAPWAADGTFLLYSKNSPVSFWGVTQRSVPTVTQASGNATFHLVLTAPSTPGDYHHVWQMRKVAGEPQVFRRHH